MMKKKEKKIRIGGFIFFVPGKIKGEIKEIILW
jgi:hypothetical protein